MIVSVMIVSMLISAEERQMYAAKAVAQELENKLLEQGIEAMRDHYRAMEPEDFADDDAFLEFRNALAADINALSDLQRELNRVAFALEKLGALK
jgi:repressor of nif and glnA expression